MNGDAASTGIPKESRTKKGHDQEKPRTHQDPSKEGTGESLQTPSKNHNPSHITLTGLTPRQAHDLRETVAALKNQQLHREGAGESNRNERRTGTHKEKIRTETREKSVFSRLGSSQNTSHSRHGGDHHREETWKHCREKRDEKKKREEENKREDEYYANRERERKRAEENKREDKYYESRERERKRAEENKREDEYYENKERERKRTKGDGDEFKTLSNDSSKEGLLKTLDDLKKRVEGGMTPLEGGSPSQRDWKRRRSRDT